MSRGLVVKGVAGARKLAPERRGTSTIVATSVDTRDNEKEVDEETCG